METLFDNLSRNEQDVLYFAPAWIALLIAGADDHIDSREMKAAEAFINGKKDQDDAQLKAFYTAVAGSFRTNLNGYKELLPANTKKRNQLLVEQLGRLNDVLPKVGKAFAAQYYTDMKALALRVAEASGSIFSIDPVNEKEKEFLQLSMIRAPE